MSKRQFTVTVDVEDKKDFGAEHVESALNFYYGIDNLFTAKETPPPSEVPTLAEVFNEW
jgi:hypothetical protein